MLEVFETDFKYKCNNSKFNGEVGHETKVKVIVN